MNRKDYYYDIDAPKPNVIVAAASAVVTNDKNQILLHKRRDNNSWSLLGGAMECGENIGATIIREVKEESGLDVRIEKLIGVYSDPNHVIEYSDGEIRQQFSICFHCIVESGGITVSKESFEVQFFDKEELSSLLMHPAQRIRLDDFFLDSTKSVIR
ncbi:NUDIX domain-containing protein [Cohnella cellulosilytica]|uniref:NUDIX domain-containing protein n=1 Tax=Cohnella cellulosilytica TaxID=986710 RepID=A0ABW2FI23_9BACL